REKMYYIFNYRNKLAYAPLDTHKHSDHEGNSEGRGMNVGLTLAAIFYVWISMEARRAFAAITKVTTDRIDDWHTCALSTHACI
ncbi:hypothetical protein, partial [Escherichia coli]|uniref:hypothetical protein n=1 Tax=Escherichia coli TaxID=562 RepID=UPI00321C3145